MKALLAVILLATSSAVAENARTVVPLNAEEREHVLGEMRAFLAMLEKATAALAQNDFDALAAAARSRAEQGAMPPAIAQKLPPAFRTLARSTHEQIDSIAADAAQHDRRHSLEQTARLLQACNACHAAYQFPR